MPWHSSLNLNHRGRRRQARFFLSGSLAGQPHKGKVLLAIQAHSDDIPLSSSGTVAKLIEEGYTGYLVRATNDDMGDAPGLGTPGTIGDNVLGNERDNAEVARVLGCQKHFDLNYSNHRMADVSLNEVICRLIFIIRLVKADTVVCWDPWAHDEENPDHYTVAKAVEAACWMAGRDHDYPEQFAAGLAAQGSSGQVLLRPAAGDHTRGRYQQADRQENRSDPG